MDIIGYFQINTFFFYLSIVLLSLCIGSFLNVVVYRLPIMLEHAWRQECHQFLELPLKENNQEKFNLVTPRSRCCECHKIVKAQHNIPLISYLFLRGKCAYCDSSISLRYPVIELMTALLSVTVAWHFGLSWQTPIALIMTWLLICLAVIDFDHQILPDSLNFGLLWLGLLANVFGLFTSLNDAILGAAIAYLSLWSFAHLFQWITKKEGMGHGDFKLFAALGACLGYQSLLFILLLSTLFGASLGIALIVFKNHDRKIPIPFGPFLAIAGWVYLIWGTPIINMYLHYARF